MDRFVPKPSRDAIEGSDCNPQRNAMNINCDQSELATSAQSQMLQQMLVLASSPEVPVLPLREVNLSAATLP